MYLFLPLIAAVVFAFGSMVFKRAFQEGAGLAHATVVINGFLGLAFCPLIFLHSGELPWRDALLPVLPGAAFVLGHLCNALALRSGDVSLATPLLGSKVIFVALLGWLVFGTELTAAQWGAAALATAGVVTLGLTDVRRTRRAGFTTLAALASAACFAGTDTMTQAWAQRIGVWGFLAIQFIAIAALSLCLLPCFGPGALRAPRAAWKWILVGAAFTAAQAFIIMATIAIWQDAPGVNVVYATRGLWSIALVWHVGHHLRNTERHSAGPRTMLQRACAALLLLGAVALTVQGKSATANAAAVTPPGPTSASPGRP